MRRQCVMIMTDSQRWDMVGCYRETGLQTPCLDALAAHGVRYERAYTTQPVCGPARSALFTGLYPAANGSWSNGMAPQANVKTIGQRLHDRGIHCAYIGKWHLDGSDYFGVGRCPQGWDEDEWYDMRRYLDELPWMERVVSRSPLHMEIKPVKKEDTYGWRVAQRAIAFMQKHQDEDYFLVVSFDEPHYPFLCPPPYDHMYDDYEFPKGKGVYDDLADKPDYQRVWRGEKALIDPQKLHIRRSDFFGCNSYADMLIGQVVTAAPTSAMLLYTSDHGDMLNHHGLFAKGPAAYDDVTRIPLIIRHPQGERGAVYNQKPVSHISVCPTIVDFFGLAQPAAFQGKSLLPTVLDTKQAAEPYVFMEFSRFETDHDHYGGFQPMRAVFDGRYKLAINLMSSDELYDLQNDPDECVNLIAEPTLENERQRLHDALLDHMCEIRDPFRGYYWDRRPWRTDAAPANWRYRGYTRQQVDEDYYPRQLDYVNGLPMKQPQRPKITNTQIRADSLEELADKLAHYDEEDKR